MVLHIEDHCVFGPCPWSDVLKNTKDRNVSEMDLLPPSGGEYWVR
jgi:hypothetical protein